MALADSSDVDAALMAKLSGDPQLMTLMPGGVYWDVAGSVDLTKFVIVSQVEHEDAYCLPGRCLWERFIYLVKAVTRGPSGTEVKQASARIHDLLQGTLFNAPGYFPPMNVQRLLRVRHLEVDEATNVRWQHRGGHYEVMITPL